MERAEKKKVVITGGSSGVGADMAVRFAEAGHQVFICGRRQAALTEVAAKNSLITAIKADVCNEAEVKSLFDEVGADGMPASIIIANAGIAASASIDTTSMALWQNMINVNLTGVFLCLREAVGRLKAADQKWGRMVAISSMTGKKGYPYIAAYSASKHGVIGLVRSAAQELAKTQITVNAVCPGYLDNEMTDGSIAAISQKTGMSEEEARKKLEAFSPQRRLFPASEVTETVYFLCSEQAGGINGQAISVDGGETA